MENIFLNFSATIYIFVAVRFPVYVEKNEFHLRNQRRKLANNQNCFQKDRQKSKQLFTCSTFPTKWYATFCHFCWKWQQKKDFLWFVGGIWPHLQLANRRTFGWRRQPVLRLSQHLKKEKETNRRTRGGKRTPSYPTIVLLHQQILFHPLWLTGKPDWKPSVHFLATKLSASVTKKRQNIFQDKSVRQKGSRLRN